MGFNCFQTPVLLISYNRLSFLKQVVDWLERSGYENIHIVDNASTFPPLLEYLDKSRHHVHRLDKNFGHLAVWQCGQLDSIIKRQYYAVSDCDILPVEECPAAVLAHFHEVLQEYEDFGKVGFSLKIDDLPECYIFRAKVIDWESQHWKTEFRPGLMNAPIDTTFALYRPGMQPSDKRWWKALRTCHPYTARHLPWYQDSEHLSEEELQYQKVVNETSCHWSVTDALTLKEQNTALQRRVLGLEWQLRELRTNYWQIRKDPRPLMKSAAKAVLRCFRREKNGE